ncbi:GGDEF domain-containing protein [Inconstantimicrobium mannanitabidum]|uniref:Uncharacterized protein n=1 Tax=Inconstantimicrobium mannanitabidum TaxID=1604901 RepID=A0ACB5RA06_9CLOT|nr:GGDEF domain-containing protein [Clostridium sp. TW13]GKX66022.1 hypothetical protein rsdtw13_12800 [Clostridium sp. TW13]
MRKKNKVNDEKLKIYLITFSLFILFSTIALSIKFSKTNNQNIIDSDITVLKDNWILSEDNKKDKTSISLPESLKYKKNTTIYLTQILKKSNKLDRNSICLYLGFSNVIVYLDNKVLYKYSNNDYELYLNKAKNTFHMINLPTDFDGKKLTLEFHMLQNSSLSYEIQAPIVGNKLSICFNLLKKQSLLIFVLFFVVNFVLLIILILSLKIVIGRENLSHLFYVGMFSLLSSMYTLSESSILQLLTPNTYLINILTFMPLLLLPIPILMIVLKNIHYRYKNFLSYIIYLVLINFYVQCLINFLGILDFRKMLLATHFVITTAILSFIYTTVRTWKQKTIEAKCFTFSLMPLFFVTVLDFFLYYFDIESVNIAFFEAALLLFVVFQVIYIIDYFLKYYRQSVQFATYKEMAYTDIMTSIGNRTRFQKEIEYMDSNKYEFSSIWCILMDLNNLKKTNDNLGHASGDELIKNFANILKDSCKHKGNCYRTGGDEFIALFKNTSQLEIEKFIKDLNYKIEEFNYNNVVKISVALGYDEYKSGIDENISQLISRADKLMYKNKLLMKSKKVKE